MEPPPCPGPLIALINFSPGVLRWCIMHVIHLGILYVCNGACLTSGLHLSGTYYWIIVFNPYIMASKLLFDVVCPSFDSGNVLNFRKMLLDLGYFTEKEEKMSHKLAVAYRCFRSWCVTNSISCSQPPFTEGLVPSQNIPFIFSAI